MIICKKSIDYENLNSNFDISNKYIHCSTVEKDYLNQKKVFAAGGSEIPIE